jgi:hypothetical protein
MKLLTAAKNALLTAVRDAAPQVVDIEKRSGLYVSRSVLNGKEWHDWAVKYGVPDPLAADDLHVTVLYSSKDVKLIPDKTVRTIYVGPGGYEPACFVKLGPKDQSLAVCFWDYALWDRHHAFIRSGAVHSWPDYRPHMTLSNAAGDFEISDEALAAAPLQINLGPEVYDETNANKRQADADVEGVDDPDGATLIVIIDIAASAAQQVIDKSLAEPGSMDINPVDRAALADVAAGHSIRKSVATRIAGADWAPEAIKGLAKAESAPKVIEIDGRKFVERELRMTVQPLAEDIRKQLPFEVDAFKMDEEERLAWGWASVSTVKGKYVTDFEGQEITTKAQRQWLHSLMKGQRAGKMDHEGADVGEVVEGIVLDADVQKALGIDLGLEGVLCCTHYTCEKTWNMVKTGKWMHSIAGRVLVETIED